MIYFRFLAGHTITQVLVLLVAVAAVVGSGIGVTHAFTCVPARKTTSPITRFDVWTTDQQKTLSPLLFAKNNKDANDENDNNDDNENTTTEGIQVDETEKLQQELDKLGMINSPTTSSSSSSSTPMFGSFDADRMDNSAVPIPMFTALILFVLSCAVTFELFYVGLNGFPEAGSTGTTVMMQMKPTTTTITSTSTFTATPMDLPPDSME